MRSLCVSLSTSLLFALSCTTRFHFPSLSLFTRPIHPDPRPETQLTDSTSHRLLLVSSSLLHPGECSFSLLFLSISFFLFSLVQSFTPCTTISGVPVCVTSVCSFFFWMSSLSFLFFSCLRSLTCRHHWHRLVSFFTFSLAICRQTRCPTYTHARCTAVALVAFPFV